MTEYYKARKWGLHMVYWLAKSIRQGTKRNNLVTMKKKGIPRKYINIVQSYVSRSKQECWDM